MALGWLRGSGFTKKTCRARGARGGRQMRPLPETTVLASEDRAALAQTREKRCFGQSWLEESSKSAPSQGYSGWTRKRPSRRFDAKCRNKPQLPCRRHIPRSVRNASPSPPGSSVQHAVPVSISPWHKVQVVLCLAPTAARRQTRLRHGSRKAMSSPSLATTPVETGAFGTVLATVPATLARTTVTNHARRPRPLPRSRTVRATNLAAPPDLEPLPISTSNPVDAHCTALALRSSRLISALPHHHRHTPHA